MYPKKVDRWVSPRLHQYFNSTPVPEAAKEAVRRVLEKHNVALQDYELEWGGQILVGLDNKKLFSSRPQFCRWVSVSPTEESGFSGTFPLLEIECELGRAGFHPWVIDPPAEGVYEIKDIRDAGLYYCLASELAQIKEEEFAALAKQKTALEESFKDPKLLDFEGLPEDLIEDLEDIRTVIDIQSSQNKPPNKP